jgi:hypothetical protein
MQALAEIEQAVRQLSRQEQESLREWLEDLLEDQLELNPEFVAKIERGERDMH